MMQEVKVELLEYPVEKDWMEVKRRALVTVGKSPVNEPDFDWKVSILRARHSPIRRLFFAFYLEIPYYVSVHLARHIHAQPYIQSQRNDRQKNYDRRKAPQDATVCMIWDMNAEELITICNKRLCNQADATTREVVALMRDLVIKELPEFETELVPICEREHRCYEMFSCGRTKNYTDTILEIEKKHKEEIDFLDESIDKLCNELRDIWEAYLHEAD